MDGVKEEEENERFLNFPELGETKFTVTASKASPNINSDLILLVYSKKY